jgi:hypothetical protein
MLLQMQVRGVLQSPSSVNTAVMLQPQQVAQHFCGRITAAAAAGHDCSPCSSAAIKMQPDGAHDCACTALATAMVLLVLLYYQLVLACR